MRDNLIPAGDKWDEDALCQDIMGFWTRSSNPSPEIAIWGGGPMGCSKLGVDRGFLQEVAVDR
jgi:hypothetical protein